VKPLVTSRVVRTLPFSLVEGDELRVPVEARLVYDPRDPYAVVATFRIEGSEPVPWVLGRDLLIEGLVRPTGHGDVHVTRSMDDPDVLRLALSSPSGDAVLECPVVHIESFLQRTYDAVPVGTESAHVNVDGELRALLGL
jgi:hypothetical protein